METLIKIINLSIKTGYQKSIIKNRHGIFPYKEKASLEQLQKNFNTDIQKILIILNNCYKKIENYSQTMQLDNNNILIKTLKKQGLPIFLWFYNN